MLNDIDFWINFSANLITIVVGLIAIYVFFFNKEKITSAINFILNYSNQLTLSELKFRLERLNDYNANDASQKEEVINILHEIEGQINGNKILKEKLSEQLTKITSIISNVKLLTEPKKRSLVSELRESLRHIDASNYSDMIDGNKNKTK